LTLLKGRNQVDDAGRAKGLKYNHRLPIAQTKILLAIQSYTHQSFTGTTAFLSDVAIVRYFQLKASQQPTTGRIGRNEFSSDIVLGRFNQYICSGIQLK
jgi:hypothetical protein